MKRLAGSLRVVAATIVVFAAALASQAGVASASAPLNLRSGMRHLAVAPLVAPTSNDVGTWEVEGGCSGETCYATVMISLGEQEKMDPACHPKSYCVSTLSGGLYFYGESVSISPGSSGSWVYNCEGCRGKENIKVKFEGNKFTGEAESVNEMGVGTGEKAFYNGHLISGGVTPATVSGKVVTPAGDGEAGVKVELFGGPEGARFATTDANGNYSFEVEPGEYTVHPVPAGTAAEDEFKPEVCPGTNIGHQCQDMKVEPEQQVVATFSAGFTLSGHVLGSTGSAVKGATVQFKDEEQGTTKTSTATTNGEGIFEARLPPGTVTASVEKLSGTEYFAVPSAVCKPSKGGCVVELNQDQQIEFTSCVVPNPNGEALPAGTPNPIPGAQTVRNLEAVGCWAPQSDGTFTSTKPVRLNGIDVNPDSGTTITLHPDATVTSNGPAGFGPGALFLWRVNTLDLSFQASQIGASDLGTGNPTFGIPTSIKGVPFSLTTGGSLQTLVPPWVSAGGKTSMTINLQFPTTLNATSWDTSKGGFFNGGASVPSIGGVVTLSVTNRDGLIAPEVCAKYTGTGEEFNLWGRNFGGISQFTACYDFHAEQWTLTGLFKLPDAVKRINRVNVKLGWIKGWNWNEGQIEFDGLQIPLAGGVFLQRIGGKFYRDFTVAPPVSSNFAITAGLSFGPQLNGKDAAFITKQYPFLDGAELFSLDGEGVLQIWAEPALYKLRGNILMLRGTPYQAVLADGNVEFYSSGRFDLSGELRLAVPIFHWGIDGQVSGFLDTQRNVVQLTGTTTVTVPFVGQAQAQVLSNNGALAVCISRNGKYSAGGVFNYFQFKASLFSAGTCEIGNYTITAPDDPTPTAPKPGDASASRASDSRHLLRLPDHLTGTTIAVHGSGAPPLVELRGPGLTMRTPSGSRGLLNNQVFLEKVQSSDTTYITLYSPHGGSYMISSLPGSAPITSVRAALPAPRAKLKVHLSGTECKRTLKYTATVPGGESVALYAQNGTARTFLGDARTHGQLSFSPDTQSTGAGQIVGLESRGSIPRATRTLATFKTVALTGPERISGLRLHKGTLSWTAACNAAKYTIVVHAGKRVLDLTSTSPTVKLPALKGSFTVTVTAIAANGTQGLPRTQKLQAK